jgi:hypothetical protein
MQLTRKAAVFGATIVAGMLVSAGSSMAAVSTDNYNAGYIGSADGNQTETLSTDFVVPTMKCTSKVTEANELTVFVYGSNAADRPTESGADIRFTCGTSGGDALSLVTDNSAGFTIQVHARDKIEVTVSASATGDSESYTDVTSGATASITGGAGFTPTSFMLTYQCGFDDGGVFPGFSPLKFSSVQINGAPLSQADPVRWDENSSAGKREVDTSKISQGEDFTETFVSG